MNSENWHFFLWLICFALIGCAQTNDSEITNMLIGEWVGTLEGTDWAGHTSYFGDGTFVATGESQVLDGKFRSEGRWNVENGELCITPTSREAWHLSTNEKVHFEIDLDPYCDVIIEITVDTLKTRSANSDIEVSRRVGC